MFRLSSACTNMEFWLRQRDESGATLWIKFLNCSLNEELYIPLSGIRTHIFKRNKITTKVGSRSLFIQGNDKGSHAREIPCVNPMKCAPFVVLRSPDIVVKQHLMSCVVGTREHGRAWMFNRKQLEADSRLNRLHNLLSTAFSESVVSHHYSSNQRHWSGHFSMSQVNM